MTIQQRQSTEGGEGSRQTNCAQYSAPLPGWSNDSGMQIWT